MKPSILLLSALLALGCAPAHATGWQPGHGLTQERIWPGAVPDALPNPAPEAVAADWAKVTHVSEPTMTRYPPRGRNTGAAIVVFPGGGYQMLAMDLEGSEICDWLTSRGITCVLLKYRVPDSGPTWTNGHRYYPKVQTALQDAQRTLGLVREHAAAWQVDPHNVGVIGFSAGGHLVAAVSTHFQQRTYPPVDAADRLSSRPDFAIALYPGHLWVHEDEDRATRNQTDLRLRPDIHVTADTPPTFLLMAEDDHVDGVEQALAYYVALQKAQVPTEMHLYAQGGHAFGLRQGKLPIGQWPRLVETWLHTIGVLPAESAPAGGLDRGRRSAWLPAHPAPQPMHRDGRRADRGESRQRHDGEGPRRHPRVVEHPGPILFQHASVELGFQLALQRQVSGKGTQQTRQRAGRHHPLSIPARKAHKVPRCGLSKDSSCGPQKIHPDGSTLAREAVFPPQQHAGAPATLEQARSP